MYRADIPRMGRGGAATATWIFRGDESRRRGGGDVDIPWRQVAPRYRSLDKLGLDSGAEFAVALDRSKMAGIPVLLADRDVDETLQRVSEAVKATSSVDLARFDAAAGDLFKGDFSFDSKASVPARVLSRRTFADPLRRRDAAAMPPRHCVSGHRRRRAREEARERAGARQRAERDAAGYLLRVGGRAR